MEYDAAANGDTLSNLVFGFFMYQESLLFSYCGVVETLTPFSEFRELTHSRPFQLF